MAKKKKGASFSLISFRSLLGFLLAVLGIAFIFWRPQTLLPAADYTFQQEPVEVSLELLGEEAVPDKLSLRVIIPELAIDLPVKPARVIAGYWEVFPDAAGFGLGSGLPGEPGNQVIFAHAREGLFLPLKEVKQGMSIYVLTQDSTSSSEGGLRGASWYAYQVKEIKEVFPNQVEVIAPTEDETLTLYTCSGFADSKRLIVVGKRV